MGISLKDKIVFITGASSGIGAATAMAFARHGARLLLCARRLEQLQAMDAELREAGAADVFSFQLDVRDREAVEATLAHAPRRLGRDRRPGQQRRPKPRPQQAV